MRRLFCPWLLLSALIVGLVGCADSGGGGKVISTGSAVTVPPSHSTKLSGAHK
jgi:hypothetical protein